MTNIEIEKSNFDLNLSTSTSYSVGAGRPDRLASQTQLEPDEWTTN